MIKQLFFYDIENKSSNEIRAFCKVRLFAYNFIFCKCLNFSSVKKIVKINNYQIMTKWCYEKAKEYKTNDQSILNLLMQEFNIETHDLTESYGAYPTSNISKDAHIIHAIGPAKFWRGTYNKEWEENNKIWIRSWRKYDLRRKRQKAKAD